MKPNIPLLIFVILSFMACNHQTTINDVNEETEVVTGTIEQVDTVEQEDDSEDAGLIESVDQKNEKEKAIKAFDDGDAETLKRLARQGNQTAKELCEQLKLDYNK